MGGIAMGGVKKTFLSHQKIYFSAPTIVFV
jgi:hypothetical protein